MIHNSAFLIFWWYQIGNPLLEFNTDFNSRAQFLWSHGLISDAAYHEFTFACNFSQIRRQAVTGTLTPVCSRVIKLVSSEISRFIDNYDVTLDVCLSSVEQQSEVLNQLVSEVHFQFLYFFLSCFCVTNLDGFVTSLIYFFFFFSARWT